jgi:surface antigen
MRNLGLRWVTALAGTVCLSACSIAVPMPSFLSDSDATASAKKPVSLASGLDEEDARRADAALNAALTPDLGSEAIAWDNPRSGSKGSFTAIDEVRTGPGGVCRKFRAEVVAASAAPQSVLGSACHDGKGKWAIDSIELPDGG